DLPTPRRILEARLEARELLVGTDMKVELQDRRVVARQHRFEVVDLFKALRPDRMVDELVHARHEDVLVIGSIEDRYLAFGGRMLVGAPKEIVRGFVFARLLECENAYPLRVHAAEDVANDAVFAGRVERLQDDE